MPDDPDESFVIAALLSPTTSRPLVAGGDDAALVLDNQLVTVDTMVESIHFDAELSPEDVGWKLAAVNVSDLGACGAQPDWALLALSLPRPLDRAWVTQFAAGLQAALTRWGVRLVGGDTTASPGPIVCSLTMGGHGEPVGRDQASAGNQVWVTGTLGDAAAGHLLHDEAGLAWLRRPVPPVGFGLAVAQAGVVTAMMDLSDGLARDLPRLCAASGTGALIYPDLLPRGRALASIQDPVPLQVAFGDDYQLLLTASPSSECELLELAQDHDITLTLIGEVTPAGGARLHNRSWPPLQFTHFRAAQ